jgi:uncharacterized membrane protein YdjX (TVP38/TMEM64 family)
MLMTDMLAQLILYLDGNIFLVSILLTIGLNLFVPGSLVIIFFVGMYGLLLGSIYSLVVLLLSSTIPYVLINVFHLSPDRYVKNKKVSRFFHSASERPSQNAILIRLSSIPYLLQNVLCSIIQPSYINYLVINFLSLIPWLIGFGLFAESVRELKFEFLIVSLLLLGLFITLTQRHVKKQLTSRLM